MEKKTWFKKTETNRLSKKDQNANIKFHFTKTSFRKVSKFQLDFWKNKMTTTIVRNVLIGGLLLLWQTAYASDWQEVLKISRYSSSINRKDFSAVTKRISALKKPAYSESFLAATLYQRRNLCSYAIRWFARSTYLSSTYMPPSYSYSVIQEYLQKNRTHAPMRDYALLRMAKCYLDMNIVLPAQELSQELLQNLPQNNPKLHEELLFLQANINERMGKVEEAEQTRLQINELFPTPQNFIKLGDFYRRVKNFDKAFRFYMQALEHPQNDSTYVSATSRVQLIPNATLLDYHKVRIAEGYRILKRYTQSLSMWKEISPQNLDATGLFFYLQNYSRLLIHLRQFSQIEKLLQQHRKNLPQELHSALFTDLGKRLVKANRYTTIIRVIPANAALNGGSYYRLYALNKLKIKSRKQEILQYAKQSQDKNDTIMKQAKQLLFDVCLDLHSQNKQSQALQCYDETIHLHVTHKKITSSHPANGQALYFKALLLEELGQTKEAKEIFRLVYQNAEADFYSHKALPKGAEPNELPLPALTIENDDQENTSKVSFVLEEHITEQERNQEIRKWLSYNSQDPKKMKLFFSAKEHVENYAVDPFWQKWKKRFFHFEAYTTADQRMGILYYLMGYKHLANQYLGAKSATRYLLLQKVGFLKKDVGLVAWTMRAYARIQNKKIDPFFLNKEAASLLYPTPYFHEAKKVSDKTGLGLAEIYALMKQESNFRANAVSRANARGLMQLMPATAAWLNKKLKVSKLNLFRPSHNILLGSVFFNDLLKRYKSFELAAIAYNAGPGRLKEWRSAYQQYYGEMLYEKIPIKETYDYIRITRSNFDNYHVLIKHNFYNQELQIR